MIEYWIWLSTRKWVGAKNALMLLSAFGTAEEVYRADREQLSHTVGVTAAMLPSLLDKNLLPSKRILSDCLAKNIQIATLHEQTYPAVLKAIDDTPPVLYYKGSLPDLEQHPVIGIVGARQASAYGLATAERFGYQLHKSGCVIVSGMAKGIDAAAMRGALKAGNRVIAVLGCGVDRIYPQENKDIYTELLTRGCIVSEYPPGTPPLRENFPPRNRIISGLSDGVLVVEAAKHSGSLITAKYALEQNRDVFAVPGSIGLVTNEGSNHLIQQGATLVQSANDIAEVYRYRYPDALTQTAEPTPAPAEKTIDIEQPINYIDLKEISGVLSAEGIAVLKAFETEPRTMDELTEQTGLTAGRVLSTLTLLEVKGYVQHLAGNRYRRLR